MGALKHNFFVRGYFKNRSYDDAPELVKNEIERLPKGSADQGIHPIQRSSSSISTIQPS